MSKPLIYSKMLENKLFNEFQNSYYARTGTRLSEESARVLFNRQLEETAKYKKGEVVEEETPLSEEELKNGKICKDCETLRPLSKYYLDKRGYRHIVCRDCEIGKQAEKRRQERHKLLLKYKDDVFKLHKKGLTNQEIKDELGITINAVFKILRDY